ncbi:MAG: RNase adapter RapZ [Myxococcota bacterium]
MNVVILTGQSGSGKSTAIRALEDQGYLCIDNIPAQLIEVLLNAIDAGTHNQAIGLVIDVRQARLADLAPGLLEKLRQTPHSVRLVYLETREQILFRRYSETRRRHPLDRGQGLRDSLLEERQILGGLRALADDIIDTSELSSHQLKERLTKIITGRDPGENMLVSLVSFGFKHGLPLDADMVLDVRFLPNPHFVDSLRPLTGLDERVRNYVLSQEFSSTYVEKTFAYLSDLLPQFQREAKSYLTLAIGCTGGRHRSVTIVTVLAQRFAECGIHTEVRHRDISQEGS